MKKLRFYVMLLAVMMTAGANAESVKYLVLNSGGEQMTVALTDNPVMTLSEGVLKVTVAGEEKLSAELSQGVSYRFVEDNPTGIEETVKTEESVRREQGHVYVEHAKQGEVVRVFTIDGKQVAQVPVDDNGTADIDLTGLGKGLYIVKSAKTAIKYIKR